MMNRIPYSRQIVDEGDIRAVVDCLRSDFLTQGPRVTAFELETAACLGVGHGVAVANGTAALHLVCKALELGPGGLLWTSPNSFVSSANAGRYVGADVDFVDIDLQHGSIDPEMLARKLDNASRLGRLPDILIAVHFAGHTIGFDRTATLCAEYGVTLVEDGAHAFGASYEEAPGVRVGAHSVSAATIFSFHPLKSITTGEGGLVVTRSAELAKKIAKLRTHGITKKPELFLNADEKYGGWYYEQQELGFNYRICDIQAALGLSQLGKLETFLAARRARARRYAELLGDLPLVLPPLSNASSWHLFVVRVNRCRPEVSRKQVYDALREKGIETQVHYIPIHTQPYYRDLGFAQGDFEQAENHYANCLSLPIYPTMSDAEQDRVVDALKAVFGNA